MITPIFKSHYSLQGRSILTLDKDTEIKPNYPVSIGGIVDDYELKEVTLVEDDFAGFFAAYQLFDKLKVKLKFGLVFTCINKLDEKNEAEESKIWVFMKNSAGYKDLCLLWNIQSLNKEAFYYHPRILWDDLRKNLTPNLQAVLPPFDSFLHKNQFHRGSIIPNLPDNIISTYMDKTELAWGDELKESILEFDKNAQEVSMIYYLKDDDFLAWQTMKCIYHGGTAENPNLEWGRSNRFSFESYLRKIGKTL